MPEVVVKMHLRTPVATLQKGITAVDGMGRGVRSIGCIVVLGVVRVNTEFPWKGNLAAGERGTRCVMGVRRGLEKTKGMEVLLCYVGDCDERVGGNYQGTVYGEGKNDSSGGISKAIEGNVRNLINIVVDALIIGALKLGAFKARLLS